MTPTPGPWRVWPIAGSGSAIVAPDDSVIVRVPSRSCRPDHVNGANLRLIAAAPDLLTEIKRLESAVMLYGVTLGDEDKHMDTVWPLFQAIEASRAAIAKAEGQ